jgi:hypothetical protein
MSYIPQDRLRHLPAPVSFPTHCAESSVDGALIGHVDITEYPVSLPSREEGLGKVLNVWLCCIRNFSTFRGERLVSSGIFGQVDIESPFSIRNIRLCGQNRLET